MPDPDFSELPLRPDRRRFEDFAEGHHPADEGVLGYERAHLVAGRSAGNSPP